MQLGGSLMLLEALPTLPTLGDRRYMQVRQGTWTSTTRMAPPTTALHAELACPGTICCFTMQRTPDTGREIFPGRERGFWAAHFHCISGLPMTLPPTIAPNPAPEPHL